VLAPFPYWRYVKLPSDRALDRALAAARGLIMPLIEEARSALVADPQRRAAPPSLMEAMLVAASEGAQRLSDTEVLANVFTLLLAGEDTTANTLAWIVCFIAQDPALQRALQAEVDGVLGAEASLPSYEHMQQLPLLTAVVHETLRLKGPAPFIALSAARDVQLGDVDVPAGTPVFVLLRALALEAEDAFDPQRWLDAEARARLARSSMPFGAGPRICPGRQLALLECALACSALLRRFDMSAGRAPVRERFDFAMEPEGLRVTFSERRRL
jgi:cytochrome P450